MSLKTRPLAMVLLGTLLGASLTLGQGVWATRNASDLALPLDQMRTFTDVFSRIKNVNGLDPHSAYLNAEQYNELRIGTTGEFGGLGIEVAMEDGFVKVVSPIDDTPAQRAGVEAGDLIIRLDDTPVKGLSLSDAVKLMRGKPGSPIELTIIREGEDKPLSINIKRDIIKTTSVRNRMLDDSFGYVRISNFQTKTTADMLMVLDLRNNPGGVLSGAVGVSDAFLNDGMIVYTDGREEDSKLRYDATQGDILDGNPLVVLVNGGSASASEIVAGAMQDHKRAIIMGTKTFGKGSVQSIHVLQAGGAVKLTSSRYYTPEGRSIQALGIEPDIINKPGTWQKPEEDDSGYKPLTESSLSGHLTGTDEQTDSEKQAEQGEQELESTDELVFEDYQLYEALNLLKGMAILKKQES